MALTERNWKSKVDANILCGVGVTVVCVHVNRDGAQGSGWFSYSIPVSEDDYDNDRVWRKKSRPNLQSELSNSRMSTFFLSLSVTPVSLTLVDPLLTGEHYVKMTAEKSDTRHPLQSAHDLHSSSLFLFLSAMPTRRFGKIGVKKSPQNLQSEFNSRMSTFFLSLGVTPVSLTLVDPGWNPS